MTLEVIGKNYSKILKIFSKKEYVNGEISNEKVKEVLDLYKIQVETIKEGTKNFIKVLPMVFLL